MHVVRPLDLVRNVLLESALLCWSLVLPCVASPAAAQDEPAQATSDTRIVYTVLQGDTLSSIAQRFYGDPNFEKVLVEENGLKASSGLIAGLRIHIPFVHYHRVESGETWNSLGLKFLGDTKRGFAIAEANQLSIAKSPEIGASLLIPYPVRHTSDVTDTVNRIADRYCRTAGFSKVLMKYNKLRNARVQRGQMVLVPMSTLLPSEEAKRWLASSSEGSFRAGEVQKVQHDVQSRLPDLHTYLQKGAFHEAFALGHELLSHKDLTGNQMVSIHKDIATAAVALDRQDLAVKSFEIILRLQPDLELDPKTNSPIVRKALELARSRKNH